MWSFKILQYVIICLKGDSMVIISNNGKKKLSKIDIHDIFVIADFDRTLTTGSSESTFSLFSLSGLYGSEYETERTLVHDYYRQIELDARLPYQEKFELMRDWALESYGLMLKYKVRESDIENIIREKKFLELRSGVVEFINNLNKLGIPLIINSAGIGNFIECILRLNNCYSDNIFISANFLIFKDGVIVDSIKDIIHSMNKYDIVLSDVAESAIKDRKMAILIGDQLSDLNMDHKLPNNSNITFGFLEANIRKNEELFRERFDVVLKDNEGFESIEKLLRLK